MESETLLRALLSDSFREEMQTAHALAYEVLTQSKTRGGKWSAAETGWTDVLAEQFGARQLPEVEANSSLRALLATATNSNAMRVTKRYSSRGHSIGKVRYTSMDYNCVLQSFGLSARLILRGVLTH
jgi:hypothetical protein